MMPKDIEKSKDAWLSIGEVADQLELPTHVLRFWGSQFVALKPVKRVNGRRYYRPQDVAFLRGLKNLLHEKGYTIKGAQNFIRSHGVDVLRSGFYDASALQGIPTKADLVQHRGLINARDALYAAQTILRDDV